MPEVLRREWLCAAGRISPVATEWLEAEAVGRAVFSGVHGGSFFRVQRSFKNMLKRIRASMDKLQSRVIRFSVEGWCRDPQIQVRQFDSSNQGCS